MTYDRDDIVTVGIICYNQEDYIAETIESVLAQDYRPLQIVIADDCSTDGTKDIIEKYRKQFPDIIDPQYHPQNIGISENILSLFPPIKGRFFCWLGGDDYFLPGKITAQLKYMRDNPSLVMSYHNTNLIDEDGFLYTYNDPELGQHPYEGHITRELIMHRCFISALSIMVDMDKVKDLRPKTVTICSDWLYFIEASMTGLIGYMPDILGVYRRHNRNTTKKIDASPEEKVYTYLHAQYPQYDTESYKGQAWSYTNYMIKHLITGSYKNAASIAGKLIMTFMKCPPSVFFVIACLKERTIARMGLLKKTGTMLR